MIISSRVLSASEKRGRNLPAKALQDRQLDFVPDRDSTRTPNQLSLRARFLSASGARPTAVELERLMGTNDLVDEFYLERALLCAHPVARISLRTPGGSERGCATGFMVSPRLLLTNEHVFTSADEAATSVADFNYRYDLAGNPEAFFRFRFRPDLFFLNDDSLDFALVSVEPASVDGTIPLSRFGYHRLIQVSGKALVKEWMTIVQHPGGARRQFAIRENQCIEDTDPDVVWYRSDTAQGSSGSPVFNDSFQVVALHHAGVPKRDSHGNYVLRNGKTVKDLGAVDDSEVEWIANAGIRVSRICARVFEKAQEKEGHLQEFKTAMEGGDVLSVAYKNPGNQEAGKGEIAMLKPNIGQSGNGAKIILGTLVLEINPNAIPMTMTPGLAGVPQPIDGSGPIGAGQTSDSQEAFKKVWVDDRYENRVGFKTNFLGLSTPLLTVTKPALVAPTLKGGKIIPYEHFSVVLHKERRMPIYTAANVDGSDAAKRPEPGHTYTRKELTGLTGKFEMEEWIIDPRVDSTFQIPDAFYNKDKGSFDKGHVTRREDVCFGKTFEEVRRANGDTYHLTNCTPQRSNFNQSGEGGIWGGLEDFIAAQADAEKYCIFAGPILSEDDRTFEGTEVKIPSRFWKVVCAVKNQKLQVFAFILKQDLAGVPLEFQVNAKWKKKMVKLADLEKEVKLVKFPKVYHNADQAA
jgi:endonuclease G